jgi:group I intron endonuclease
MGRIYRLTSPPGKSYIGQTIQKIEKRFDQHQKPSSECVAILGAIQKYGWENMKKEWFEVPDEDLNFYEEMLIALMGTLAPGGYNLTEGGANGRPSEVTLQRMSDSLKGEKNPMYGKTGELCPHYGRTHTDETKKKDREAKLGENNPFYGKTHTEETKQKQSESQLGEKNPNSKIVYQYNLDGTFVRSFGSTGEAARHLNKNFGSHIGACARGEREYIYGFKWSYTEM